MQAKGAYLLLLWGSVAGAESAELKHQDEIRRSLPENYIKGWTAGLTYCFGEGLDITGNDFLRTTKAVGHERLKHEFEYITELGKSLGPPYVPEGEEPAPPEPPCEFGALAQASEGLLLLEERRKSILAGTAALACEGPELTPDQRDAIARKAAGEIALFDPTLTRALRATRVEAPPRVRALITGARKLDEDAQKNFSRCENAYWWRYRDVETLSCQLYVMKLRLEYLSRNHANGDTLVYRCYNDKPPEKPESSGTGERLNESDITGLGTH